MSGTILPQTAAAIAALLSIGLDRSHFTVQTPRDRKRGGYGLTSATFYTDKAMQEVYLNAHTLKAAGYAVIVYFLPGRPLPSSVTVVPCMGGPAPFFKVVRYGETAEQTTEEYPAEPEPEKPAAPGLPAPNNSVASVNLYATAANARGLFYVLTLKPGTPERIRRDRAALSSASKGDPASGTVCAVYFTRNPDGESVEEAIARTRKVLADLDALCEFHLCLSLEGDRCGGVLVREARDYGPTRCFYGIIDALTGVITPVVLPEYQTKETK